MGWSFSSERSKYIRFAGMGLRPDISLYGIRLTKQFSAPRFFAQKSSDTPLPTSQYCETPTPLEVRIAVDRLAAPEPRNTSAQLPSAGTSKQSASRRIAPTTRP